MRFDWDAAKSHANLEERGFGFELAALVFQGSVLERGDLRRSYGEMRVVAVGVVGHVILTVVYTDRRDTNSHIVRRIISARRSNRRERKAYLAFIEGAR